jgi:excisionase family DNA binding protein
MPAKTFKRPVVSISQQSAPVPLHEPILTGEQVAERLQLKPSTIYELTRRRNRGPLPAMRTGKFLRFKWSEVERWLMESREAA